MEKIRFIITEESMKRLHDSLVMLRASLFSEELKANQSTYISEIGAELSKATIDKEPETCTWTEIEDEDGNYYEAMLRASLFSEELKANQSTYISEIGAELSKATIDKEPETCTWTEIEDEDGNYYEASCNGEWHEFIEGAPEDSGFDFCPFCGKFLVQKLVSEE